MEFPKTKQAFEAAGYKYGGVGVCRSCKAEIVWYISPGGKYNPIDADTMLAHFSTCPDAARFRKKKTVTSGG